MLHSVGGKGHAQLVKRGMQLFAPVAGGCGGIGPRATRLLRRLRDGCNWRSAGLLNGVQLKGRWAGPRRRWRGARRRSGSNCTRSRRSDTLGRTEVGQSLFNLDQFTGLDHFEQTDFQVEARLQRELQITKKVESDLQVDRKSVV